MLSIQKILQAIGRVSLRHGVTSRPRCFTHGSYVSQTYAESATRERLTMKNSRKVQIKSMPGQMQGSVRPRSWNIPAAVRERLRNDALRMPEFQETLFDKITPNPESGQGQQILERLKSKPQNEEGWQMVKSLSPGDVRAAMIEFGHTGEDLRANMYDVQFLEEICLLMLKQLSRTDQMLVADIFYSVGYQAERYLKALLGQVTASWNSTTLSVPIVLQLLFYIGIYRNAPAEIYTKIEDFLLSHAESLSGAEVGLITHAFFASNCSMKNYALQQHLSNIVLRDVQNMALYQICNVLKVMRHSGFNGNTFYKSLGDLLCKTDVLLSDRSLSNFANICSAYASQRQCHKRLFEAVAKRVVELFSSQRWSNVRLKDLSRIVWSYEMLQEPVPANLRNELIRQLCSDQCLEMIYPEIYIEALCALAMGETYLPAQISNILSPAFVKFKMGRLLEQNHQLLLIDQAVSIEVEDYDGARLPQEVVEKLMEGKENSRGLALHTRTGLAATWLCLQELLGRSKVKCHYILNFSFLPDLEIHLGVDGQPLEVELNTWSNHEKYLRSSLDERFNKERRVENYSKADGQEGGVLAALLKEQAKSPRIVADSIHLKPQQSEGPRKITVKILSENQYRRNDSSLLGVHQMELRILSNLGYEILAVNPADARALHNADLDERRRLVQSLIIDPLAIRT